MSSAPRFLVVEGNLRAAREAHEAAYGLSPGAAYAQSVGVIAPEAVFDIAYPADEGANLPDGRGLEGYDAVFLTGSALNVYFDTPEVRRQIELMRTVFASGTPCFGSCWGIQIGVSAAGGEVRKNPRGREVGFARRIAPTAAGAVHPLLEGRPPAFDAPAIHEDEVVTLPGEVIPLASNGMSAVQAAEIRVNGTIFWGVQYHPEFSLRELASILRRRRELLIREGFFASMETADAHLADIDALHDAPARKDLAWKLGLDEQVLDERRRLTEFGNFLRHVVWPNRSARGRG